MSLKNTRVSSPFDDSAIGRQHRMGLLLADGKPDRKAMAVFCGIFGGLLFDTMCDLYQGYDNVTTALYRLLESAENASVKEKFLMICLQYDNIRCQLPDPIWWISGNPELVELFSDGFLRHLRWLSEQILEET